MALDYMPESYQKGRAHPPNSTLPSEKIPLRNGLLQEAQYCVTKFVLEMENIAVWLAEGKISKELLNEIVTSLIFEDDYSEDLKLRILSAVAPQLPDAE